MVRNGQGGRHTATRNSEHDTTCHSTTMSALRSYYLGAATLRVVWSVWRSSSGSTAAVSNHPNRNWKRRWTVDERTMEARHECGLIVQFVAHHAGGCDVHSPNRATLSRRLPPAEKRGRLIG